MEGVSVAWFNFVPRDHCSWVGLREHSSGRRKAGIIARGVFWEGGRWLGAQGSLATVVCLSDFPIWMAHLVGLVRV